MDGTTRELVAALTATMGRDEETPVIDFLIDNLAEAVALLTVALEEVLKATELDERTVLL